MKLVADTFQFFLGRGHFLLSALALLPTLSSPAIAQSRQQRIDAIVNTASLIVEQAPATSATDAKLDNALRQLTTVLNDVVGGVGVIEGYDFGGAFGYVNGRAQPNPATGSMSCPAGYQSNVVSGLRGLDYTLTYCFRLPQMGSAPILDYGGSYGYVEGSLVPNAISGTAGCLPGYTQLQVLGQANIDWAAFICYRSHINRQPDALFGGAFGYVDRVELNHPITGTKDCPAPMAKNRVWGTHGLDYLFYVCELNLRN